MMNKKIVEKDRSKEALRRIEKIYKQNSIEKLDINLDACGSNIIFSKKTFIHPYLCKKSHGKLHLPQLHLMF